MKPGTYTQLYVHLVFAARNRDAALTVDIRGRIFEYISGIISTMDHKLSALNQTGTTS